MTQSFILDVEGYPSAIISLFVVLGLFILRYTHPNLPRPFKTYLPIPIFYMAAQCLLLVFPFLPQKSDTSLPYWLYPVVGIVVLVGGVVYWVVWRVVLPWVGGFEWREGKDVLVDGTVVTVFKREKVA